MFSIQHLKHGGGRVTMRTVIGHLVNLVKQEDRIHDTSLFDSGNDSAGDGTDIGSSVSTNLCFIADTAQ